ncbi:MAG: bacteriohemerythrin [Rhodoferax sp.]
MVFEHMLNGVAYCEICPRGQEAPDFRYLYTNPAFHSQTGVGPVVGRLASEVFPGILTNDQELLQIYLNVATTGVAQRFERYVHAIGHWFSVSVYCPHHNHFVAIFDVVSERKAQEKTLSQAQSRLALAQRAANAGIWDWDMPSGTLTWSPELFDILGLDAHCDSASFENWSRTVHADDRNRAERMISEAIERHIPLFNTYRVVLPGGEIRWIDVYGDTQYDAQGTATRMTGICVDVTRRMQLERITREFESIVQSSRDAIISKTLDGTVTSWNPGAEAMFGYSAKEMIGHPISVLIPAQRQEEEARILQQICAGHPVDHFETVRICKSGQRIDVDIALSPLRDSAGTLIGASKIARDITRQKQSEKALREKDSQFRVAVQTSTDGFWICDMQGKILEVNDAYVRLSGYTRDELLQMKISQIDAFESQQEVVARIERIVRVGYERFVVSHLAKGGRKWPAEVVTTYSPIDGGRFFSFMKDLTEQQKSAEIIWHQANFDGLTDLPNRALFFDRLSQECSAARRSGKLVALLFADLDAFKPVNDQFGHDSGDLVLRTVASRWQTCVRESDTIARLGGDEFAIIVGSLEGTQEASTIAGKLIQALDKDIALPGGRACRIGASIGIAIYPTNASEMDSLLRAADAAMYTCKGRGKNTFSFANDIADGRDLKDAWVTFNDSHLIGVSQIDVQHRQLVRMINDLNQAIAVIGNDSKVKSLFDDLVRFTVYHFETEHDLMVQYAYPETPSHDYEHGRLVNELKHLSMQEQRGNDLLVLQRVKDWLIGHIQNSDKPMGAFLLQKGAI